MVFKGININCSLYKNHHYKTVHRTCKVIEINSEKGTIICKNLGKTKKYII